MPTALVTGATAGIGRAFATRLAADGHDLILVARDATRIKELADELSERYGHAAEELPADLATGDGITAVERRLAAGPVDVLVNNAGGGLAGQFWTVPADALTQHAELSVVAVARLTRAALPGMLERGRGSVLNVSSFGAVLPGRTGAAYTAAKAYVLQLSESVGAAVRGTGVRVLAVCPGFTRTELHERAGIDVGDRTTKWWLDPDEVVEQAFRDLAKGRTRSIAGSRYRLLARSVSLLPHFLVTRSGRRDSG
jgi:short-subunit dehydrogenase